jgi:hypothetical protein
MNVSTLFTAVFFVCHTAAFAQHNSSDFKDAATTGPFPLYLGVGFSNSLTNSDFRTVGREFLSGTGHHAKNRLYGLHVAAGCVIAREEWKFTFVGEVRHLLLARFQRASDTDYFVMRINQTSLGVGGRFAAYPFVLQAQVGPILRYSRDYDFKLGDTKTRLTNATSLKGVNSLFRLGILDPAGTEGGPGMYFEFGYNFIRQGKNDELSRAIRKFDEDYTPESSAKRRYGYLAFGLILPIAIRIK